MDKKDRRYYQTKKWLAKRNAIMERAGGICEYCLLRPAYQVHHRTYARFKREDKSDLMAVCPLCHRYIHTRIMPPERWQKMSTAKKQKAIRATVLGRLASTMHIPQNTLREKYLGTISLLVDHSPETYTRELMLDADQLNFFLNDRVRAQEIVKAVTLEDREREKELQAKVKKTKPVTAPPAAQKPGPNSLKDVPEELPKALEKPDEIITDSPQEKKPPAKTQSTLFDGF